MAARTLTGIALVAGILALTPLAADAATVDAGTAGAVSAQTAAARQWGTYYAPGRRAKAYGTLWAAPKDDPSRPTSLAKVKGKVFDRTRTGSACGWAVFRISYRDGSNAPHTFRTFTNCKYGKAKKFSFDFKNVYQVELKVCAEPRAAKPSLNCLYAGTWKNLYTYFE
ncbi:hypothetical protein Sru01_59210 [Sphaerisporangium rufum]|uniref:Secreted protein n=1 Tax=Sphaerisporangium rufum TaxID=1381558 RepID=A0A919V2P3_9ACTN|nr:hypothetical protein [Sphaerisporangium rufum]GII80939.1 hypothetical protein Sru01_59210 [Sphaerisporangium rufum]